MWVLGFVLVVIVSLLFAFITARLIAIHYIKIMDSYTKKIIELIEGLIAEIVEQDKHQ